MTQFANNPSVNRIPRHSHQPIEIEDRGIRARITENGHVILRGPVTPVSGTDEVEWDELDITAGLILRLARLLKDTRKTEWVDVESR